MRIVKYEKSLKIQTKLIPLKSVLKRSTFYSERLYNYMFHVLSIHGQDLHLAYIRETPMIQKSQATL